MNVQELLNEKKCKCGRNHSCDIERIIIKPGAIDELAGLIKQYGKILFVADNNTCKVCGEKVVNILGNRLESRCVFETDGFLIPNETAIEEVSGHITEETDLIIGVGSGVIQDLCKYVSFRAELPYFVVATAPSMDGYASKGAAMITDNMKITYDAHVPKAIIGDVDILKNAPIEMIQSGYGDIIGKLSCLNDWKLSVAVNDEYFCDYVYDLTMNAVDSIKNDGEKLLKRDADSVQKLMEALIIVGVAMAYVGNSRPASGSEHHLSHFFEITGIMENTPYLMHGTDVLFSAVETCRMRERIAELEKPTAKSDFGKIDWKSDIRQIYGKAADGVIALQEKLGTYENDKTEIYSVRWDKIREVLHSAAGSDEILRYIDSIGLDYDTFVDTYGEEKISRARWYAKDLKDRYTVLWLNYYLFCGER